MIDNSGFANYRDLDAAAEEFISKLRYGNRMILRKNLENVEVKSNALSAIKKALARNPIGASSRDERLT